MMAYGDELRRQVLLLLLNGMLDDIKTARGIAEPILTPEATLQMNKAQLAIKKAIAGA